MATATKLSPVISDNAWLKDQSPGWLRPAATGLAVFEALALLAQAGLIALIINQALINEASVDELTGLIIGLIAVFVGRGLIHAARAMLAERASAQIRLDLRQRLFDQICLSDPARDGDFESGALAHQLTDRVDKLDAYYSRFLPQQYSALFIPLLIVIVVVWVNWLAGLLLAIAAPIIPLFMALIGIGAERLSRDQATVTARLSGLFHDRLRGLGTIQRFGASERVVGWLSEAAQDYRERTMKVLRLAFLSSAVLEFFAAVAIASLAIYIGLSLIGYIELGPSEQLSLLSGLFILLLAPDYFLALRQLAQHWHDRADALAAASDLRALLKRPVIVQNKHAADLLAAAQSAPGITVENLAFAYPKASALFSSFNLDIKPGEHVLIKGPSGSGKSTLLMLLAGLIRPQGGSIHIGAQDIGKYSDQDLSQQRAYLSQSSAIFDQTLRDNLCLGRTGLSDQRLLQVLKLCGLADLPSELANGLDTRLGNNGSRLSGGQARRVALARTLLEPRPLLLLDEPSEHLDPDSESALWSALESVTQDQPMTIIVVSHRPRAERWASRVLTLTGDSRLESESHSEQRVTHLQAPELSGSDS